MSTASRDLAPWEPALWLRNMQLNVALRNADRECIDALKTASDRASILSRYDLRLGQIWADWAAPLVGDEVMP